jgi:hypothetical protein
MGWDRRSKLTILPSEFLSPLDFRGCAGIVGVAMLLVCIFGLLFEEEG